MRNDLNLSLPDVKPWRRGRSMTTIVLIASLAAAITMAVIFAIERGDKSYRAARGLPAKKLEELALKFERQKLPESAARVWTEYLSVAGLSDEEMARVWFRIGSLLQEAHDYENALDAYYRSEAIAKLSDVENELGRRTIECLENLGKFASLDKALSERTAIDDVSGKVGGKGSGEILIEIGAWKITSSDLDIMMESEVDAQLASLGGALSSDERLAEKKRILDELRKQDGKERFLQQFVAEELLYRFAREEKIDQDEQVRAMVRNIERKALAQAVLDREVSKLVSITPDEIRAYYEGHKEEFKKDGRTVTFEETRNEAAMALRLRKAAEVQQQLLDRLRRRYDVVIHTSKLKDK